MTVPNHGIYLALVFALQIFIFIFIFLSALQNLRIITSQLYFSTQSAE